MFVISYDDARCNPGGDRAAARDRGRRAARARRARGRRPHRGDRRLHHRRAQRARRRGRGAADDPRPRGGGSRRGGRGARRARARRGPRRRGRHAGVRRVLLVHPRSARPVRGDARRHPPAARGRPRARAASPCTPTAASAPSPRGWCCATAAWSPSTPRSPTSTCPCSGCGVTAGVGAVLNLAEVQAGSSVAVVGCGALGLWMIQGARVAGATTIVAVEPRAERRELARAVGATHAARPRRRRSGRGGQGAHRRPRRRLRARGGGPARGDGTGARDDAPRGDDGPGGLGDAVLHRHAAGGRLRRRRQAHPELPVRRRAHPPRHPALRGRCSRPACSTPMPLVSRRFALEEVNEALAAASSRELITAVIAPRFGLLTYDCPTMSTAPTDAATTTPPEPDLTPEELIARAIAMRPELIENQADAEARTLLLRGDAPEFPRRRLLPDLRAAPLRRPTSSTSGR